MKRGDWWSWRNDSSMKGIEKGISARYSVRSSGQEPSQSTDTKQAGQPYKQLPRCYICNSPTHLARD